MKQLSFLFLLIIPIFSFSQTKNAPPITLEDPHNTVLVHLYYLNDIYRPDLSAQTIYGDIDSTKREKIAIQLKQILDGKGLFVQIPEIPQNNAFFDTTTLKPYYTLFPEELPEVYLEKIDGKWYYSRETVQLVPTLHKRIYPIGSDWLINLLPQFGQEQFLGLAIWQYLGMALLLVLVFIVHFILSRIISPILKRISSSRFQAFGLDEILIGKIAKYLSLVFVFWLLKSLIPALLLPIEISQTVLVILRIILTIIVLLLLLRIVDLFTNYAKGAVLKTTSKLDEQLLPIVRKMLQVVLTIGAIINILRLLDVNVTALIAGVSIGGLALALAAQDTVKNLIGSAMIFIDQPFQIGDWIEGAGIVGTVVEVGFRTTRIQQVDSSIMAVPNGTIANMAITNKGLRVFRLFQTTIGVTYNTPPDLIEAFLTNLKKIIEEHPHTMKNNYYVYLTELAASSLNIMFRTSIEVSDYSDELRIKEELLFKIIRLAEEMKVDFAFPSSTLYVEKLPK